MSTPTPLIVAKPGLGKVAATIPIIYDAKGYAVAHVLGGQDAADTIVTAVNNHESLVVALTNLVNESAELSPLIGEVSVRSVRQAGKFMKAMAHARTVLKSAKIHSAGKTTTEKKTI